jgi:PAS domain S-box-containing protein
MLTPDTEAATLDAIPVQVWTATPDGPLDFVNQFVCDYFGVDATRLLGEGWQHLVHPADLPVVAQRWGNSLSTGQPYAVEFRLLRAADKQFRWHEAQAIPLHDAEGRIRKWVGTNKDIDAIKRAEEIHTAAMARVRQEREQVRRLFAQTPVALSVHLGPEHQVEQVSQIAQQWLTCAHLDGLTLREALPALFGRDLFARLDWVYAHGEAWEGRDVPIRLDRQSDGHLEDALFHIICQPLRDDHGTVYGVMTVGVEITE